MVSNGYSGCIQDVRLNHASLPVADSNDHATVTYVGETPAEGCMVGPCHPNPCNTGTCTETAHNMYTCTCADGKTQTSPCEDDNNNSTIIGIAVAIAITIFIALLIVVLIVGLIIISKYGKKPKKYTINDTVLSHRVGGAGRNEHFEIHANIYTYEEEGGEEDAPINNTTPTGSPSATPRAIVKYSPTMSTLERNRDYDVPKTRKQFTPNALKKLRENNDNTKPDEAPPTGTTPPVRGTPTLRSEQPVGTTPPVIATPTLRQEQIREGSTPTLEKGVVGTIPVPVGNITSIQDTPTVNGLQSKQMAEVVGQERASTPVIDQFIENKVNTANNSIQDIDSLKEYSDEGIDVKTSSLSDISAVSTEEYTLEQLRSAGILFNNIADILEPIYIEEDELSDDSQTESSSDSTQ